MEESQKSITLYIISIGRINNIYDYYNYMLNIIIIMNDNYDYVIMHYLKCIYNYNYIYIYIHALVKT